MANPNPLSDTLRELRLQAGLSQAAAARKAGITQSKISRAEAGLFLLSEADLRRLCQVYQPPPGTRRQLTEMTRDLKASSTSARAILQRGGWWMQERIGKLETGAHHVRSFTPAVIIGLLQTRLYVDALFGDSLTSADRERAVAARLARQDLLSTDREFVFVMAEGALRWNIGGASVMASQLDSMIEASYRPNVQLGIIPWTTPTRVPAIHGFTLYDSRAVIVGTQTATAIITDAPSIRTYEAHWDELLAVTSWEDEARAVIARSLNDYRSVA
jgi:transcriptional regulator with XRE-family HTH domain